jgi:hypothetical protein
MRELEATWSLKQEDNAGAEAELSHLLTRAEVHRLRKRLPHLNKKISPKYLSKFVTNLFIFLVLDNINSPKDAPYSLNQDCGTGSD